jgi:hypothetical protein
MRNDSGQNRKKTEMRVFRLKMPQWVAKLHRYLASPTYPPFTPEQLAPRFWGGAMMPAYIADPLNYLVTGTINSGKTLLMLLWLRTVLAGIKPGSDQRMVAYDPKNNVLRDIHGMGAQVPIKLLLPSDVRSVRLDLHSMVVSMADAIQFAAAIVPAVQGEKSPFYTNACRSMLAGVMQSLFLSGARWDLRDVLLILEDETYLREVLGRSPHTRSKLRFMANSEVWQNLQATMEEKFGELRIVAAYWSNTYEDLSLDEFLRTEQIIVLGKDQRIETALAAVYQVFFKRLSELILALPENKSKRIFMFLDEFPRVCGDSEIPGFEDLLSEGRDRGVSCLIAFQHIDQLVQRYEEKKTNSLISYFRNQAYFGTADHKHAEWCAKQAGEERKREWNHSETIGTNQSYTSGPGGGSATVGSSWSYGISTQIVDRSVVLPSTFLDLPLPAKETGLVGYYRSAAIGLWQAVIPGDWIARNLPTRSADIPGYLRRPNSQQLLDPFGPEDLKRLGLTGNSTQKVVSAIEQMIDPDA